MAILKIARLGHPVLRKPAEAIPPPAIRSPEIQRLIDDMVETMRDHDGVGLAGPQVHQPVQLFVIELRRDPRSEEGPDIPLAIFLNPRIVWASDDIVEDWEGCLSIPDLRGKVPRSRQIQVQAYDRQAKLQTIDAQDFYARVIQHEYDHLHGIVFLDRMKSFETLTFLNEYIRYWARD